MKCTTSHLHSFSPERLDITYVFMNEDEMYDEPPALHSRRANATYVSTMVSSLAHGVQIYGQCMMLGTVELSTPDAASTRADDAFQAYPSLKTAGADQKPWPWPDEFPQRKVRRTARHHGSSPWMLRHGIVLKAREKGSHISHSGSAGPCRSRGGLQASIYRSMTTYERKTTTVTRKLYPTEVLLSLMLMRLLDRNERRQAIFSHRASIRNFL